MNINRIGVLSLSILCSYGIYSQTNKLIKKIFESTILRGNSLIFNPVALSVTITVCAMTSPQIQLGIFIALFISNLVSDPIKADKSKTILSIIKSDLEKSRKMREILKETKVKIGDDILLLLEIIKKKTNERIPSFLTHYTGTDELINKHDDILRGIRIYLHQKSVGHVILCGDPGSGKTATTQLFANKIATNEYPEFRGAEIYKLDATSLASNIAFLGQLSTKISHFKRFIQSRKNAGITKLIIVIDEIHQLCGMGQSRTDTNDVWQMIKEDLAESSSFIILGTTTEEEYLSHIVSDPTLSSRLTKLSFPSVSDDDKKAILNFRANDLNKHHELNLSNEDRNKLIEEAYKKNSSTNLRDLIKDLEYVYSEYDLNRKITPLKCVV